MQFPRTMITFNREQWRFTYRIGAIIIHNDRVLCERGEDARGHWYFLPGGRAELGESAVETVKREIEEELGTEAEVERLVFVNENFFVHNATQFHELGLYFLVRPADTASAYQEQGVFEREEEARRLTFSWLPLTELEKLPLYPAFLKKELLRLPTQAIHIVHRDDAEP